MIGLHDHDRITRIEKRSKRHRHPLARPEHHRDLLLGVGPAAVERLGMVRNRVPQLRQAERKRILVELIARVAHLRKQVLEGEIQRIAPCAPARFQNLAQRHRLDAPDSVLRAAEHRGDPAPYHVVDRRFVGETL